MRVSFAKSSSCFPFAPRAIVPPWPAVITIVMRWLARRAKRVLRLAGVSRAHAGGVAFQQRFDSALRLNPRLDILVADGEFPMPSTWLVYLFTPGVRELEKPHLAVDRHASPIVIKA